MRLLTRQFESKRFTAGLSNQSRRFGDGWKLLAKADKLVDCRSLANNPQLQN